jgi:hypothetical protein
MPQNEGGTMSSRTLADTATAYVRWLADVFESEAGWRERKAADHPGDGRHAYSATALRAAARYVRGLERPLDHSGIRAFVEFDAELDKWVAGKTPLQLVAERGLGAAGDIGRSAGRFFFHLGSGQPSPRDFDRLIGQTFTDMLASWGESIEGGLAQPPPSLVEFFDRHGTPLWADEEEE